MADYSSFKVTELKELIKERGIASAGLKLKQHFIDALVANDASTAEDDAAEQVIDDGQAKEAEGEHSDVATKDTGTATPEISDVETRKRKRKSPSPVPQSESINKRVKKTNAGSPTAVEDEEAKQTSALVDVAGEGMEDAAPGQDTSEEKPSKNEQPVAQTSENSPTLPPAAAESTDTGMADTTEQNEGIEKEAIHEADKRSIEVQRSKHAATRALYIRELVRPLQASALREHLITIASAPGTAPTPSVIELFHLDKLRTHAFARFDSITAASRARNALHDQVWPDEPMRKTLWADFIPDEQVEEWINIEVDRSDMTRWEVVYRNGSDGTAVASLQAAAPTRPSGNRQQSGSLPPRQPSGSTQDEPMPDAAPEPPAAPSSPRRPTSFPAAESAKPQSKSFDSLDSRFHFTQTKPKLYFQPVPRERVEQRLDEFRMGTSQAWGETAADPAVYAEGELRRYTLEDDKIVDGGADFGMFGKQTRPGFASGPVRRGGRGGGGGGGAGRGWRPSLDHYRGGGFRR